ncbi:MAG: hypothetical protein MRK02_07810 [Candidatus Scalindua sp.]|nr:hypothetical protein [Candidatus Scalindua sp.]
MDITVIGASGAVGSEIARKIISTRLLEHNERLQLVGRKEGRSSQILYGLSTDLKDAYDEICPNVEVILNAEEISGDLIIMAAGETAHADQSAQNISRDILAKQNIPIFEHYASALADHGHGNEIVICVSNPNELNVEIFARHLNRKQVIGMGAYLDSLRFRKEIAKELGLRRQKVHAFMAGEHGCNMIPLWSNVHIYGFNEETLHKAIRKMRRGCSTANFHDDLAQARESVNQLINENKIREAYDLADQYPPDLRTVLKPNITHFSGSKTITGTVNATLELVNTITMGHDAFISGQIKMEGEFYGIYGTFGVPFVVGNCGVEKLIEIPLDTEEKQLLLKNAKNINQKICHWLR